MYGKVAKLEEGRQGAAVTKCVKGFFFEVAKVFNLRIAESNSIKLLLPTISFAEKVKIPLFRGYSLSSQAGGAGPFYIFPF